MCHIVYKKCNFNMDPYLEGNKTLSKCFNFLMRESVLVKSVQIRSFVCSVISCIRTEQSIFLYLSVFSPNAGKDRPEKTLSLNTFHLVSASSVRGMSETIQIQK